jgi:uroporphyrinogen decarboxylase
MRIFLHSCGSVRQFIPDLIEVGFDILNPVQTNSRDMDPEELKREFGKDIVFWGGGVDTTSVINRGTPDEIRRDVLRRCEIFSKDGGFVFAPIHNILSEVPPQNIVAAYNAVREFNGQLH